MDSQIDKSNFRQFILQVPDQFEEGLRLGKDVKIEGDFSQVCISGMGGSALPANLLRTYIHSINDGKPVEIFINRYYSLPPEAVGKNTLNFIASYSGNTEETLSSLEEIKSENLPFVGFSSGGKLEDICKSANAPHVKLPVPFPNYQPRMGTGYFFSSMLQALINQGLVSDFSPEIKENASRLKDYMEKYEQKGRELATKLSGKTPVIYASPKYKSVAMIWKIKLNENGKTPAFWNFFPELNHNEMVGFTNPQSKFFVIMLRDRDDNPRNLKRYEATEGLLKEKSIESEIIDMDGSDVFSKMFLSICLADWASYYLALEYQQDPTPVDMVEKLKKILA